MLNIRMADIFYRGFWTALDWIYPPVCIGCGEPGYRLCTKCLEKIQFLTGSICRKCGHPISKNAELCKTCADAPPAYDSLRSLARYEGVVRECVHALKYENNQSLGEFFSSWMAELVHDSGWLVDMVIPVPLSPIRMVERGYNQSALLARPLAISLGIRYKPYGLERIRNTRSQVELSAEERRHNVAGAFEAIPDIVREKQVLLIDDVTTTGSTIKECTLALKAAGASAVYCLTLARPIQAESLIQIEPPSSII